MKYIIFLLLLFFGTKVFPEYSPSEFTPPMTFSEPKGSYITTTEANRKKILAGIINDPTTKRSALVGEILVYIAKVSHLNAATPTVLRINESPLGMSWKAENLNYKPEHFNQESIQLSERISKDALAQRKTLQDLRNRAESQGSPLYAEDLIKPAIEAYNTKGASLGAESLKYVTEKLSKNSALKNWQKIDLSLNNVTNEQLLSLMNLAIDLTDEANKTQMQALNNYWPNYKTVPNPTSLVGTNLFNAYFDNRNISFHTSPEQDLFTLQQNLISQLNHSKDKLKHATTEKEVSKIKEEINLLKLQVDAVASTSQSDPVREQNYKKVLEYFESQEEAALDQTKVQARKQVLSTLSTAATLANFKEGVAATKIAMAALDYAEKVEKFSNLMNTATSGSALGGAGLAAASIELLIQIADILGAFGPKGPTFEQIVLDRLDGIQKQIERLHEDMLKQFGHLNERFNHLFIFLEDRLGRIQDDLRTGNYKTETILKELNELRNQLALVSKQNTDLFQDKYFEELTAEDKDCIAYSARRNKERVDEKSAPATWIPKSRYSTCLKKYLSCATDSAKRSILNGGTSLPTDTDVIYRTINNSEKLENINTNFTLLAGAANRLYQSTGLADLTLPSNVTGATIPASATPVLKVPNPNAWYYCAERYLQMAENYPHCFADFDKNLSNPESDLLQLTDAGSSFFNVMDKMKNGTDPLVKNLFSDHARGSLDLLNYFEKLASDRAPIKYLPKNTTSNVYPTLAKHLSQFADPSQRELALKANQSLLDNWEPPKALCLCGSKTFPNAIIDEKDSCDRLTAEEREKTSFTTPPSFKGYVLKNYPEYIIAEKMGLGKFDVCIDDAKWREFTTQPFGNAEYNFHFTKGKAYAEILASFKFSDTNNLNQNAPVTIFRKVLSTPNSHIFGSGQIQGNNWVWYNSNFINEDIPGAGPPGLSKIRMIGSPDIKYLYVESGDFQARVGFGTPISIISRSTVAYHLTKYWDQIVQDFDDDQKAFHVGDSVDQKIPSSVPQLFTGAGMSQDSIFDPKVKGSGADIVKARQAQRLDFAKKYIVSTLTGANIDTQMNLSRLLSEGQSAADFAMDNLSESLNAKLERVKATKNLMHGLYPWIYGEEIAAHPAIQSDTSSMTIKTSDNKNENDSSKVQSNDKESHYSFPLPKQLTSVISRSLDPGIRKVGYLSNLEYTDSSHLDADNVVDKLFLERSSSPDKNSSLWQSVELLVPDMKARIDNAKRSGTAQMEKEKQEIAHDLTNAYLDQLLFETKLKHIQSKFSNAEIKELLGVSERDILNLQGLIKAARAKSNTRNYRTPEGSLLKLPLGATPREELMVHLLSEYAETQAMTTNSNLRQGVRSNVNEMIDRLKKLTSVSSPKRNDQAEKYPDHCPYLGPEPSVQQDESVRHVPQTNH